MQALAHLESISDIAALINDDGKVTPSALEDKAGSGEKSEALAGSKNALLEDESMSIVQQASPQNKRVQLLRVDYFRKLESLLAEFIKSKVDRCRDFLIHKQSDLAVTFDDLCKQIISLISPLDFEANVRNQALAKLVDALHMKIWCQMGRPNIDNFGGRYTSELN